MFVLDYPIGLPGSKKDTNIPNSEYYKSHIAFLREWADALENTEKEE